jgi:hypothetical protein
MADCFEVVETVFGRQEGEILQSYLRAQGISCEVSQEAAGQVLGITIDGLGATQILVPSEQKAKALEAIRRFHGEHGKNSRPAKDGNPPDA